MDFRRRQTTLDLSGEWLLAYADAPPAAPPKDMTSLQRAGLPVLAASVPGNFELDLQANGLLEDPFQAMNIAALRQWERTHLWYAREFAASVPENTQAVLTFEGLDCFADVYLNGEHVASTANMLIEHSVPVSLAARNDLVVHIRPAVPEARRFPYPYTASAESHRCESLYVRKAPHMYGWDIMPRAVSAGIWRPVHIRFLPKERLETVYLETLSISGDGSWAQLQLHYRARLDGPTHAQDGRPRYALEVEGACGASRFAASAPLLFDVGRVGVGVPSAALWWPKGRGEAALYDVTVRLARDGEEIDSLSFTHGVRTVELDRTSTTNERGDGRFLFRVNGERVFAKGSNWVPVDAFHSRDAARIPRILEMADDLGCNMLRCWGGNVYEDNLFYETCDRLGIMVWQDFAMACSVYPQDAAFQEALAEEARAVVRRLRQHPSIVLWAGDNECDMAWNWGGRSRDPNQNVCTRVTLPSVLKEEDVTRPYLPSSPYIDETAFEAGDHYLPENHPWGPRDYFKGDYYTRQLCHFASEIGYHGCPARESLEKFLSPDKVWPYQDNDEWILHSTSPVPGVDLYDYRVELMAKQVRELFGDVPDNVDDFAFASQASQAEALKFFIESFRAGKWRRTGILWWNLMDGWPQISDAIVDYYFGKKLAYDFVKRAQAPVTVILREPSNWGQDLVASNDARDDVGLRFAVTDVDTGETLAEGEGLARADSVTVLARLPFSMSARRIYRITWQYGDTEARSHYLAGLPPFGLEWYREKLNAVYA